MKAGQWWLADHTKHSANADTLNAKLKLRNLLLLTQTHQVCISTREQPFWQTCMTIAASAPVTWWLPAKGTVHTKPCGSSLNTCACLQSQQTHFWSCFVEFSWICILQNVRFKLLVLKYIHSTNSAAAFDFFKFCFAGCVLALALLCWTSQRSFKATQPVTSAFAWFRLLLGGH